MERQRMLIRDIYPSLVGKIPDGVLGRAIAQGSIPVRGVGKYSILNALEREKQPPPPDQTKAQRRRQNLNMFRGNRK